MQVNVGLHNKGKYLINWYNIVVPERIPLRTHRVAKRLIQFGGRFLTAQLDSSSVTIGITARNTGLLMKLIFTQLVTRSTRTCNRSQSRSGLRTKILHAFNISPSL